MAKAKDSLNRNLRAFVLLAIFTVIVYLIIRNIGVFGNILLVLLGFGGVILVHEFGHFLVAKLSGIKVEAFSIGFPPILAGILRTEKGYRFRILPEFFRGESDESGDSQFCFTVGGKSKPSETEYRIGLIPFGGFVKMLGQDDVGSAKASDDPRSYANKPVGTRMAVIAAGVLFNAISATIVFMVVFLIGIKLPPPVVGGVVPGSPAARAGLKPGDEIIEIAGKSDNLDFSSILVAGSLSGKDKEVRLKVKRGGQTRDFAIVAERKQTPMGEHKVFGILSAQTLTIAKVSKDDANTLLERTGLRPGDKVRAVNGRDVQNHWELEEIVQNAFVPAVTLLAERTDPVSKETCLIESRIPLDLRPANRYEVEPDPGLNHIYFMIPRLKIADISGHSDANNTTASLQSGDIILAMGNVESPTYDEMREVTTEYEDRELPIKVLRVDANGIEKTLTVTVVPRRSEDSGRVLIGVGVVRDLEHAVVTRAIAVEDGSDKLDIPHGAVITTVDGVSVSSFYDIAREIGRRAGERITIDYRLDEKTAGKVVLNLDDGEGFVPVKCTSAEFIPFKPLQRLYKASSPIDAVKMGYKKTVTFIVQTYVTLKRLIGGVVKVGDLTGPVGIMAISYRIVAERPLIYYVYFVGGLISAIIVVMNLLPLPPLDGGWIVLLLVEKIKGSALSERTQGAVVYTGWALIGGLLLYVTFNDFIRYVFS